MPVTINGNGAISGLAIGTADLVDGSVTTAKIADSAVATVDIANSAVTTAKIADANVTAAKLATGAAASNLGGYVSGVTAGTGISASASTGSVTLTNTGVTSIVAGTNITVSGATGAVTVSASGGGAPAFGAVGAVIMAAANVTSGVLPGGSIAGSNLYYPNVFVRNYSLGSNGFYTNDTNSDNKTYWSPGGQGAYTRIYSGNSGFQPPLGATTLSGTWMALSGAIVRDVIYNSGYNFTQVTMGIALFVRTA